MQLSATQVVTWSQPNSPAGITPQKVYIGPVLAGLPGFQVAIASASSAPSRPALRDLFVARKGHTQTQLVVAVTHGPATHLFGPDPQSQPIELPTELAQRQLQSVLAEPDALSASDRWAGFRKAHDSSGGPGFSNSGLFATHHITQNVPHRPDWVTLNQTGSGMLSVRGRTLIAALGFKLRPASSGTFLLATSANDPRAAAVLLEDSENFEGKSPRFQLSPVAFGLAVAAQERVPWLIVLRKDQIRLYPGRDGVGVGSKGQSETFFEVDLATVDAGHAGLLPLVFSADALAADGSADQLLRDSARYATELGARLRERIYEHVVPTIAVEVAQQLASTGLGLDSNGLSTAYRVTLRILFRLLFQAYAEDRGLLPSGRNEGFDANSLKTNAGRLLVSDGVEFGEASTIWRDLEQVWNAIDQGNPQWQIPAYNGGLFATDAERSPDGALIDLIKLPDYVLGPALRHLLIDRNSDGDEGPVDFRSLSVREFGTIYEGLLESSLSLAEQDLTVDSSGAWAPAKGGDEILAAAGEVYFHSASGERKATGSYFTPKVVVDHLIERSVVPALTAHLDEIASYLTKGDAAAAAREFFDFRVADLAMGSGHFLVAAVDKIESLMRTFLAVHTVPGVTDELLRLSGIAKEALSTDDVAKSEVDEVGLLRRQVARRCIYGLDINPMSVELARLALWIHTFVPGLPMSNLDHGLVCANSLTGIGTIDEAIDSLVGTTTSSGTATEIAAAEDGLFGAVAAGRRESGYQVMLRRAVTDYLKETLPLLADVANASEASKAEAQRAAELLAAATAKAEPASRIFDAAVAVRLGAWSVTITKPEHIVRLVETTEPTDIASSLKPAHMPVLFPEVFLRDNPGFDVVVGNPPWEELMVEEPKFWLRVRPGLLGLKPEPLKTEIKRLREDRADLLPELTHEIEAVAQMRKVLLSGPYPGLGTGDIDLYQACAWRFWQLLRRDGSLGFVVPRSLFQAAGGWEWRKEVFAKGTLSVVTLVNNRQWVFPIHPQWSIALASIRKAADPTQVLRVAGPFASEREFSDGQNRLGLISHQSLAAGSQYVTLPQLPDSESALILDQIRRADRLDRRLPGWDFRPVAELHATNDRPAFDAGGRREGRIPVIGGGGFDIWNPGTGEVYAWADPLVIERVLVAKRQNQIRLARSAFYGLPPAWASDPATLPYRAPRIAFRDIARATDTRTCIPVLVPPGTLLTNKAPYLFRASGDSRAEAFLLGILSSIPLDWYARKYVELGMNFHIFGALPIPVFAPDEPLPRRVVDISGRLAAADGRFQTWAAEVGVQVGTAKDDSVKLDLIAELDAVVSLLYGLTEDQVEHVFATFHRGWHYESRLEVVLRHFRQWKGKA